MRRFFITIGALAALAAAQAPTNDACVNAAPLSVGANAGTTAGAGPSSGFPCDAFGVATEDVWFFYVPSASETVTLTLTGPGADRVAVYMGSCGGGPAALCEGGPGGVFPIGMAETALVRVGAPVTGGDVFTLTVAVGPPAQSLTAVVPSTPTPSPTLQAPRVVITVLGAGCGGDAGVDPSLSATPRVGGTMALDMANGDALSPAWLFADFSGAPPMQAPFLGGGCTLYVDPLHAFACAAFILDAQGAASLSVTPPRDPSLAGIELTLQGVIAPLDGAPFVQLTNGLCIALTR
jgi:hypothetical protein